MELIVYIIIFLICYTYILYPFLLFIIAKTRKNALYTRQAFDPNYKPYVSFVVAAYNEEKVILEKIKNTLAFNYPKEKIEIIIGSDGSNDETNAICTLLEQNGLINFHSFKQRRGKASVLNDLLRSCTGEIVVFSDANTFFSTDAIINMVRHFQKDEIGGVCGRLILDSKDGKADSGESQYWKYETFIKKYEGIVGSVMGANGGIYAIRKKLFEPIDKNTIIDDFVISMRVILKGYRLIYEESATGKEDACSTLKAEIKRKTRIGSGNLQSLKYLYPMLSPRMGVISFLFWSHKIIRWSVPLFIIVLLTLSSFIGGMVFIIVALPQFLLLILSIFGIISQSSNKFIRYTTYFYSVNFSVALGYCRFLGGLQKGIWEKAR